MIMPQNIPIMHQILKRQRITSVFKAVYCQLTGLITAVIHHCYYVQLFSTLIYIHNIRLNSRLDRHGNIDYL